MTSLEGHALICAGELAIMCTRAMSGLSPGARDRIMPGLDLALRKYNDAIFELQPKKASRAAAVKRKL